MIPKVVSLPFRIGLSATRTTLGLSTKLAGVAAGAAFHVVQSRFASPQPARTSTSAQPTPAEPDPAPAPPVSSTPASATPVAEQAPAMAAVVEDLVPPDEQPDTPLTHDDAVAKTVDDTDEVVAEFAEAGAEDGAGAQLRLEEPWEGYDSETAEVLTARIADADAAELALLELYEQIHKQRKTVLDAAARRLRELSPPNDQL